jgi:hypothetical protein
VKVTNSVTTLHANYRPVSLAIVCGNGQRRGGVPVSEFVKIALDPLHREYGRCCEGCKAMLRKMGRLVLPK